MRLFLRSRSGYASEATRSLGLSEFPRPENVKRPVRTRTYENPQPKASLDQLGSIGSCYMEQVVVTVLSWRLQTGRQVRRLGQRSIRRHVVSPVRPPTASEQAN